MSQYIVEVIDENSVVIEVGIPGPPGEDGSDAGAIVQESTPSIAPSGQLWFNPTTRTLHVSNGASWLEDISDGGYF